MNIVSRVEETLSGSTLMYLNAAFNIGLNIGLILQYQTNKSDHFFFNMGPRNIMHPKSFFTSDE